MIDRTIAPKIHDAIEFDFKLPPIQQQELSNGIPLYWLSGGVQEVAEIDWVFPAGMWYEQKPAVSNAVAAMLKNGTSKHTAQQINEALEFYGAALKVNTGNDNCTVTLYTLTKHLPNLLPMVYEILTDATFPEEELVLYKQNSIQRLMVNLRQPDFVANQRIDATLFGEAHPYGRFTKQENIEAVSREDLLAFYHAAYNLSHAKIFMAGSVGDKEVTYLEDIFGKHALVKTDLHKEEFPSAPVVDKKHNIINDANGVQGAIRIASHLPNRHHPDFAPMVVLNTLFGGYFGSRLMSNIREDKGYTYGIYSGMSSYVNGGSLTIQTEVGRDVIEQAVKEIYHEMQLLCDEPADEEELLLVKNYLLGNLLGDLDGPFSIIQRWRTLIVNGMTEEHFNRNIEVYKNVSAKELQELAKKYYPLENFFEVVVV